MRDHPTPTGRRTVGPGCHRLYAYCWQILSHLTGKRLPPLAVEVDDGVHRVTITVDRVDSAGGQAQRFPGNFFSPRELLVWQALANGPLTGEGICAAIPGWRYDTPVKYLLSNLEERGVIRREDRRGYERAQPEPDPG